MGQQRDLCGGKHPDGQRGRLRLKIEEDPSSPLHIKTIHGMGYMWEERDE